MTKLQAEYLCAALYASTCGHSGQSSLAARVGGAHIADSVRLAPSLVIEGTWVQISRFWMVVLLLCLVLGQRPELPEQGEVVADG